MMACSSKKRYVSNVLLYMLNTCENIRNYMQRRIIHQNIIKDNRVARRITPTFSVYQWRIHGDTSERMERHDCLKDNVIDSCRACYILCRWIVILCCLHIMISCTSSILCRWIVILCCHHVMMSCACSILCRWDVILCCHHVMMSCACSILCRWDVILCCHHVMMGCACSMLCRWIVRLRCVHIMMSCACFILCRWIVILSSGHDELR